MSRIRRGLIYGLLSIGLAKRSERNAAKTIIMMRMLPGFVVSRERGIDPAHIDGVIACGVALAVWLRVPWAVL